MPSLTPYELRQHSDRVSANADDAEYQAMIYGSANWLSGTHDDRIAESLEEYHVADPQGVADWAESDFVLDNAVSEVGEEVQRRRVIMGDAYPFSIKDNLIIHKASETGVYEFCLAVTQLSDMLSGKKKELPVVFEQLSRDVLKLFLGDGSEGIRTGWPPSGDRPSTWKATIEQLGQMTGEWTWSPDATLPSDPRPRDVKDEGLDFVVWKRMPDARAGNLFFAGQCACGNGYQTKFMDIDPGFEKLKKWMRPLTLLPPTRVFTVPRHIPNDALFTEATKQAGLVLDRARIVMIAELNAKAFISMQPTLRVVTESALADLKSG